MKPFEPRLMKHARAGRIYVMATALIGVVTAALVVTQAILIAQVVGRAAAEGLTLGQATPRLVAITVVAAARAGVGALQERIAHRAATNAIAELREQVLRQAVALGPRWLGTGRAADIATLVTRGLDALDAYFSKYLPQVMLVATLTPALLVVVAIMDWPSALIVLVTLPLVPLFMILIGKLTASFAERRLAAMTTLGSRVLDLLAGLPTLKALGRESGPARRVRELSQAHARATFGTVRIAFLSGAALELVSTLSVALVAVEVGLRLAYGKMGLVAGLAVIIMAPEVYLPVRAMGTHYHASANGLAAVDKAFAIIAEQPPPAGTQPAPDLSGATIEMRGVSVQAEGRSRQTPANLDLILRPGTLTALVGINGAGKSTAIAVLLGLVQPDSGTVLVKPAGQSTGISLDEIDPETWWSQIAWVPQRPALLPGTVWENLTGSFGQSFTSDDGTLVSVERAAAQAGFNTVVRDLPQGWATPLGHGGVGLSVGQRQRLALARALLQDRPVVILDEPTAHLDPVTEAQVLTTAAELARAGRIVVVVAHRPALLANADSTVEVKWREVDLEQPRDVVIAV